MSDFVGEISNDIAQYMCLEVTTWFEHLKLGVTLCF